MKFSQPDVEISYDLAKQETVALSLTVALAVKNLVTDEEKIIPIGTTAIITAVGIKVIAGTAATGTIVTGTSTGTKIAIGAGVLAAAGGVAAISSGGGGDGSYIRRSCQSIYGSVLVCAENPTTCTFYVVLNGSNCQTYCRDRGGRCLRADSDAKHDCEVEEKPAFCENEATDQICTCTIQ